MSDSQRSGRQFGYKEPGHDPSPDRERTVKPTGPDWNNPAVNNVALILAAEAIEASPLNHVAPNHFDDELRMSRQQLGAVMRALDRADYLDRLDAWEKNLYRVPTDFDADQIRTDIRSGAIKDRIDDA